MPQPTKIGQDVIDLFEARMRASVDRDPIDVLEECTREVEEYRDQVIANWRRREAVDQRVADARTNGELVDAAAWIDGRIAAGASAQRVS